MTSKMAILVAGLAFAIPIGSATATEWTTPEARARWTDVSEALFGTGMTIGKAEALVKVEAPSTAQDATLVPVTVRIAPDAHLKGVSLVVDQNPAPLAAKVAFGPGGDPRQFRFRVRVDGFTNMHAVAATEDGRLVQDAVFVKGAGGCSAPMGMSVAEASVGMGDMKMKFGKNAALDDAPQATLMIRHPNFSGMQKDPATKSYTPARFVQAVTVSRGDRQIFAMTSGISLSTNPVIEFLYKPEGEEAFKVTVVDSDGATWTQEFIPPRTMN